MRVGILTGGGDCQGLNAALRGVAKSLMLRSGAEIYGIEDGFLGLIERRVRRLTYEDCSSILGKGGTILGTDNRAAPRNYKGQDLSRQVADYYHELGLDCIVAIGGDGTMSVCTDMSEYGMKFVGLPKTIDNDLMGCDRTFGFDSAVNIVSEALDRLHTTGESHRRVMVLETMGRYAGWIALHGGMAGGADIILIPEIPYDLDEVARICQARQNHQHHVLLVVAEGAMPKGGTHTLSQRIPDSPDPLRLGGIGHVLQTQLRDKISAEVRSTQLGHVQRGGSPSAYDRILATNAGTYAANLVMEKNHGQLVVFRNNSFTHIPMNTVANKTRTVPMDDPVLQSALSLGVSFGDPDLAANLKAAI